jgi:hypothetical protein
MGMEIASVNEKPQRQQPNLYCVLVGHEQIVDIRSSYHTLDSIWIVWISLFLCIHDSRGMFVQISNCHGTIFIF